MPRLLAIGDIHGCYKALVTLETFVEITPDDTVVTLGDYVDRGRDSRRVLDWLISKDKTHKLFPLRGNHDLMMAQARRNKDQYDRWLGFGGYEALCSYASNGKADADTLQMVPRSHWDFITDRVLPYYESEHHIFVHANYSPQVPMNELEDHVLYWEKFSSKPRHISGKIVVCGHTSQKSGLPTRTDNAICIDTRVYDTGWLSCLDVESKMLWQANQTGETRKFYLDDVC
ncbi:metallophosphoesterase [Rhodopirellula maiorica SM1]|uniref:Metallophosphoesterase n=1 Tax=Rhodopirellula maiorica SM1 TaxID=1265738 RepID=M5RPD7_9BACT|nr:metallophosphoesterase family protein [Rhodopirellula maiorica]EMI21081.1 metallophosphoesterase [Rhodopirellula maiorica SM1]